MRGNISRYRVGDGRWWAESIRRGNPRTSRTICRVPGGIGTSSSFGQGLGFLRSVWRFASRGRTFSIVVPRRRCPSSSLFLVVVPRRRPSSSSLVVVPRCSSRSISQAGYGLGAGSATTSGTPRGSPRAWRWGRRRRFGRPSYPEDTTSSSADFIVFFLWGENIGPWR
jgi:hypothetical protein